MQSPDEPAAHPDTPSAVPEPLLPPAFHIREARQPDRAMIAGMWLALMTHHRALDPRFALAADAEMRYTRYVQEKIRSRDARVLIAEESATGVSIGYLMGEVQARSPKSAPGTIGFLSDIWIAPEWRQAGVGRALFLEMKRWLVTRRVTAIELYLAEANAPALAFWQAMGLSPFLRLMHLDL